MKREMIKTARDAFVSMLLALLLLPVSAGAEEGYRLEGHGPGMMWEGGWSGWVMGPLMMLLFIGAVVVVIVFLVRHVSGPSAGAGHAPGKNALDILKERFARGEIDKEEFEQRRKVLSQ